MARPQLGDIKRREQAQVSIYISKELKDRFKKHCKDSDKSMQDELEMHIVKLVKRGSKS